jgi:hypothetical protein
LQLDHRMRRRGGESQRGGDGRSSAELSKQHQIPPDWAVIIFVARQQRRITCE